MLIDGGWIEGMGSECRVLDALLPFDSEQSSCCLKPHGINFRLLSVGCMDLYET